MISFSNLYEAVVQQPTPPQRPVQQTGAQIPQTQPNQMQQAPQGQYQQQPMMQQQPQQPDGLFGKLKAGYDNINNKWEMGKDIAKGMVPIAMSTALPIGMLVSKANPALGGGLYTLGMMGMYGSRLMSAPTQAKMVVDRAKYQNQVQNGGGQVQ